MTSPATKNLPFHQRLGFALSGMAQAVRCERSFRSQVVIGCAALLAAVIAGADLIWVAVVVLACALVLALELVNTALETVIDRLHPEPAPEIKLAKDIAAGAVLVASTAAMVVAVLLVINLATSSPPR